MPTEPLPWLAEARGRAGLSQAELARRLGVPQPRIAEWESGTRRPRPELIDRLAQELGVDPWEVLVALGEIPGELASVEPARIVAALRALAGSR